MKKTGGLTKRMVAILLSGMLAVGAIPGTALASEVQENTAQEEEAITTYAVTLDANGGYFLNEWDDVLGEYIESTEILNKQIPAGGTVTTFPVFETDDQKTQAMTFSGWSLERDGELVSQGHEEYSPVDNCVLYAVWESEEILDNGEDTDLNELEEAESVSEDESSEEQGKTVSYDEEDAGDVIDNVEDQEVPVSTNNDQADQYVEIIEEGKEEPVTTDAAKSIVKSGTCGDDVTWTLDEEGTLIISGTGKMEDHYISDGLNPWWESDSIRSVVIENGVTSVGANSFSDLHDLESVVLPQGLVSINSDAFAYCNHLKSINIPDSVINIGKGAFYECNQLEHIVIPNSVTEIGEKAFYNALYSSDNMPDLVYYSNWLLDSNWSSDDVNNDETILSIEEGTIGIADEALYDNFYMPKYKVINLPSSIRYIGKRALSVNSLESINLKNTEVIGEEAFKECHNLKKITIPSSVRIIKQGAFDYSGLEYLNLEEGIREIEGSAFSHTNILEVRIPDSVEDNLCLLQGGSVGIFAGCKKLKKVVLPNGIKHIPDEMFYYCQELEEIDLFSGIESIDPYAFSNCESLRRIEIPESVNYISYSSFNNCKNLSEIFFEGNVPEISSSAFTNVTATAYYPANDPTWTEDVRKNYGGNITWEPYNGNVPGDTPSGSLKFTININNTVVIGDDQINLAFADYYFKDKGTALEDAKKIEWACSDKNAVELYSPAYELCDNYVGITWLIRGKKPGTYTITGIAPDGRKANADVVVEPKMVAPSDKKEITETSDVEMIQVTLDNPDKEYLTSFLNGITGEIKDDIGAIGDADKKSIEISSDGKTGKLIFTLTPVYGGSCEFTLKSAGGQKIVETIYSGLNVYPWDSVYKITAPGFDTSKDVFSFTNSVKDIGVKAGSPYPVNDDWGSYFENNHFTVSEVKSILRSSYEFGGVCAGMTSVMMQNYLGLFYPESVQANAKDLWDISAPSNNPKVQTLLGINQYCSINGNYHIKQHKFQNSYSGKSALQYLCDLAKGVNGTNRLIYVDLCFLKDYDSWNKDNSKGCGAHAMLVYGIETNGSYYDINGKKYKYRILTINPNYLYAGDDVGEDYCIYISDTYDNCIIPKSGTMQDSENEYLRYCGKEDSFKNTNDFYFQYITDDVNNILPSSTLNASEKDPYFILGGSFVGPILIDEKPIGESKTFVRKVYPPYGSTSESPFYILNKGDYSIEVQGTDEISLSSSDMFVTFDVEDGGSIRLTEDDKVVVNSEGQYSISVTTDKLSVPNDEMTTFCLEGNNVSDVQLDFSRDGVVLNGTLEVGTLLKYSSIDDKKECTYEIEKTISDMIVSVDDEIITEYDDYLTEGLDITKTSISSKSVDNISIELNKPSYEVQEGNSLTIDATIKTDKDRVEGQSEYIGYFAYYANRQWNQLATWDIEGGTTKYSITKKIENWSEFDDVMFTVSVFPKDSFTQGSALLDKVFLVNVSKKPQTSDKPDNIVQSGTFGNTLSWSLDKNGTLVITGNGAMPNWRDESTIPWNNYKSDVQSIVIKDGVTSIGTAAFMRCSNVTSVNIAESVVKIEDHAFTECEQLNEITIPNKVTNIGDAAFSFCSNLSTITIPGSVSSIGKCSFEGCSNLNSVEIYEGVSTIDKWAFRSCGNLLKVKIPESVNTIGDEAFANCSNDLVIYGIAKSYAEKYVIEKELIFMDPSNVGYAVMSGITNKTYTGKALTQAVTVRIDGASLKEGTDYTLTYSNNTNAGTATVTITGKGNYSGTKTATFKINKANQSITVKASSSSIAVGKTSTVSITGAKGTKSFKSSDTSVAVVNTSTGVVTGKKAGTVTITATSAATANYNAASKTVKITVTAGKSLKKPGNCHFAKWNNSKYTSCRISWNKVDGAEGYETLLSWTNGSNASRTIVKSNVLYRDCTVHPQHVSQMMVRAFYMSGGKRVFGPWSNVEYITPSPTKLTTKNASTGTNLKMNISWNIIYGCNGYNVFITTNPNGTWYWNQSTAQNATAKSSTITKCGGAKLKKNTRYYVRIVTRRKRNGVFCTVPMPSNNAYTGTFIIK